MTCQITFSVAPPSDLNLDEVMGVVGDLECLGMWNVNRALLLQKNELSAGHWEGTMIASRGAAIKYRYFTALQTRRQDTSEKVTLVNAWEAHLEGRSTTIPDQASLKIQDGQFGFINDQKTVVDKGWLANHYEARFSISSPKNCTFLELFDSSTQLLRTKLYIQPKACCSSVISSKFTVISPYKYSDFTGQEKLFSKTHQTITINVGCVAKSGSVSMELERVSVRNPSKARSLDEAKFRIKLPKPDEDHSNLTVQTFDLNKLFIQFHVSDESGKQVGVGVLSCRSCPTSKGIARVPLLNSQFCVVGVIRVPYLLVKPFSSFLSMERSFTSHWKPKPMVHVGHRGSGNSFTGKKLSNQFENTIASFVNASNSIASYVEFDVHLTKDGVPIVYHDLTTCVSAQKKEGTAEHQLVEIPVHMFTVDELQSLNMMHRSRKHSTRELSCDVDNPIRDGHPFPTLKKVCEEVPVTTGFNIEVKWPNLDENHEYEDGLEHYFDANLFVDAILKVVFGAAKSRKIIFSCFDVDICIMLRRKQNLYPVLFLTNGDTGFYTPMLDLREATNSMAIGTARAEGFLGIDTLDRDVYRTPEIVTKAHDAGLIFACYGDDISENIDVIANSSVDIAIYDRSLQSVFISDYHTDNETFQTSQSFQAIQSNDKVNRNLCHVIHSARDKELMDFSYRLEDWTLLFGEVWCCSYLVLLMEPGDYLSRGSAGYQKSAKRFQGCPKNFWSRNIYPN